MKQYIVTGYDYTDKDALDRRMAVRPLHLAGTIALRDAGNYLLGGAILDDNERMIGSVMVLQFETEAGLEAWKQNEPYITQKIWETIEIKPFKVANAK